MTSAAHGQTYQAQVFEQPGQPLVTRQFEHPILKNGEVLVRVLCCTLCGSDLHTYTGRRSAHTPLILGHEILGEVQELGPSAPIQDLRGEELRIGDRVTWTVAASCGDCFYCQNDLPQKCESLLKYGHQCCDSAHPLSGGLAEMCQLAAGTGILKVPAALPDLVACSANCATATVAAAIRCSGSCAGKTILIQGAGLLGLTLSAMASVQGATQIIVVDINDERLQRARKFGATETFNLNEGPTALREFVKQQTADRGVDLAFEMSGASGAFELGIENLRLGGHYLLLGAVRSVGITAIEPEQLVRRVLTIQGIHNYTPRDLVTAIDFLAVHHGRFPFLKLVAKKFPLSSADEAFRYMIDQHCIRVAVQHTI